MKTLRPEDECLLSELGDDLHGYVPSCGCDKQQKRLEGKWSDSGHFRSVNSTTSNCPFSLFRLSLPIELISARHAIGVYSEAETVIVPGRSIVLEPR
jgi:hypothetical protein